MPWQVRAHTDPREIDAATWNALLAASPQPTPFMRHEWLAALHEQGCASPERGWAPLFLAVDRGQGVEGVCALYLKSHSYGEYFNLCSLDSSAQLRVEAWNEREGRRAATKQS